MYYTHFGLTEAPFSIAPNPEYLFMTARHQEALAHLYHGIEGDAGFVLLTGDVGTGKTTVCRRFLHHLPDNTQVAFILNPCVDRIELLQAISKELDLPIVANDITSLRQLTDKLHDYLLANHAKGINTVLLVDEAQQMHPPVLEFIRLLTNLETNKQKLLKIILVGQPELNEILAQASMVQLSQRITARYHIYPLTISEIKNYINHRLQVAGYTQEQPLFSSARIKQLFNMTKGVPRLINVVCDRALLGAYSQNAAVVDAKVLTKAYQEVSGNYIAFVPSRSRSMWMASVKWCASVFCIALLVSVVFTSWQPKAIVSAFAWFDSVYLIDNEGAAQPIAAKNKKNEPEKKMPETKVLPLVVPITLVKERDITSVGVEPSHSADTITIPALKINTIDQSIVEQVMPENTGLAVETEPKATPTVSYYGNRQNALADLVRYVIPQPLPVKASYQQECDRLALLPYRCELIGESSWQALKTYNRPAIITLQRNNRLSYVVVVGVANDSIIVLADFSQKKDPQTANQFMPPFTFVRILISEVEKQWGGEITFIWQAPLGLERFIFKESNAALIDWLAKAFAAIDQKTDVLAKGQYNALLEKRIRLFQKKYGLKEDGKAGMETLLKLNELLGIATILNSHLTVFDSTTDQSI